MTETSLKAEAFEPRRHPDQCPERATGEALATRLITLLAGASLVLFLASALIPASASDMSRWTGKPPQPGSRAVAIVNGHHVQPRRGIAPAPAMDEVQQLYRDLMDLTAPDKLRDLDGMPLALPADPESASGLLGLNRANSAKAEN